MLVLLGYSLFPVLVIFDIPVSRSDKALGGVLGVGDSVSFKGFMVNGALVVAGTSVFGAGCNVVALIWFKLVAT